jgi:hypothetical protein
LSDFPDDSQNHWYVRRLIQEVGGLSDEEWRLHPVVQSAQSTPPPLSGAEYKQRMLAFVSYTVERLDEARRKYGTPGED